VPVRPALVLASTGIAALSLSIVAPAVALADPPQDPPGNNGTIKIEPYGATDGNANHPHPGCDFRLQLFGFDEGQTGTITFAGQAPTAGAVTAQPLSGTQQLSDDRAGGGKDTDAHFDVRGADLRLTGTPAKQGFHIKVLVNADEAPGGAKSKVFWLSCPSAQASTPPAAPSGSDTGASTSAAPTSTSTTTKTQSTSATTSAQGTSTGAATAPQSTSVTETTSTTSATTAAQAATEDTAVAGTARSSAVRGGTDLAAANESGAPAGAGGALPFTGLPAAALAGLGLAVTAAGAMAVAAGRRRRTATD